MSEDTTALREARGVIEMDTTDHPVMRLAVYLPITSPFTVGEAVEVRAALAATPPATPRAEAPALGVEGVCVTCGSVETVAIAPYPMCRACIEYRVDTLRTGLKEVAESSPIPSDWEPYDTFGYAEYRDAEGRLVGVDDSNGGDIHDHGFAVGQWAAAKMARAAIAREYAALAPTTPESREVES